jgi:hypothetical protein
MTRPSLRAVAGALLCAAALVVGLTPTTGSAAAPAIRAAAGARPHVTTSGGNGVNDVTCVATGSCVAVGQYAVEHGFIPLLDVERGATWTVVIVPLPAGASTKAPNSELSGVSCTSSTTCVAVGSYTDAAGFQRPLLVSESRGAWTSVSMPLPAGADTATPDDTLESVSCASSTVCAAVGSYARSAGHEDPLVIQRTSGSWSAVSLPLPADAVTATPSDELAAVACTSDGSCTAVGSYLDTSGGQEALMVTGSSGVWSDVTAPLPGDAGTARSSDELDSVACTTASSCVAAGSYDDAGGNQDALLDEEVSGTWANVPVALPGDASTAPTLDVLNAAACSSIGNCVAVGVYESEDNYQEALVEVETAGAWAAAHAVLPSDANTVIPLDTLSSVSCPADGDCVAVGFYSSNESYVYPKALLEVEVDGTWVAGSVLLPSDSSTLRPYSQLSSISCISLLGCVAGGVYSDLSGDAQALLDNLGVAFANDPVVPSAPLHVTVHAGHGQATVSWHVPKTNGGSRITGYTVTASPGGRRCVTTGRMSCTVRPLAATGYSFSVTASSVIGTSAPSASSVPVLVAPPLRGSVVLTPFAAGSSALTAHLLAQIAALAQRIVVDGSTAVALVGDNDGVGSSSARVALGLARADSVRAALRHQLVLRDAAYVVVTTRGARDARAADRTASRRAADHRVVATVN